MKNTKWRATIAFLAALFAEKVVFTLLVLIVLRRIPLSMDVLYGGIQVFVALMLLDLMYGRVVLGIVGINFRSRLLEGPYRAGSFYLLCAVIPWGALMLLSNKLNPFFRGELLIEKPIIYLAITTLIAAWLWGKMVSTDEPSKSDRNTSGLSS